MKKELFIFNRTTTATTKSKNNEIEITLTNMKLLNRQNLHQQATKSDD